MSGLEADFGEYRGDRGLKPTEALPNGHDKGSEGVAAGFELAKILVPRFHWQTNQDLREEPQRGLLRHQK